MTRQAGMSGNVERAEERLDRIADQLGRFFNNGAKPFMLKTIGRVREEAEDVVAEARNVRPGRRP